MRTFTLIGMAFLLLLVSFSVEAATSIEIDGIYYRFMSGTAIVVNKDNSNSVPNSYSGDVVIPSQVTYNNRTYEVTGIGSFAFFQCDSLTSVVIPETVKTLGAGVFSYSTALDTVILPESLTVMGQIMFKNCTGLKYANIPSSITSIPKETFYGCTSLESFTIHPGVTTIEEQAFIDCLSLTAIEFPSSVTTIEPYAFASTGLTELVLPNTITNISTGAFSYCRDLVSVVLPDSITSIPSSLFRECHSLPYVDIPKSVTDIESHVFSECHSLTHIELPDCMTTIGDQLFNNCYSLENVDIPETVTSIGYEAFNNCTTFTRIVIPPLVTTIGRSAFAGCINAQSANLPPNITSVPNYLFSGCKSLKGVEIPASVTTIGKSAFYGCTQLEKVNIPYGVTSIESSAYYNCSSLSDVYIPPTVQSIGSSAFSQCRNLKYIEIPKTVNTIEGYTFAQCYNLKNMVLPVSVTSTGDNWYRYVGRMDELALVGEGEWAADSIKMYSTGTVYIDSKITGVKGACLRPTDVYSYNTTPPECDDRSFKDYSGTLHVKPSCVAAYFVSPYWSGFANIVGDAIEPLGVEVSDGMVELEVGDQFALTAAVNPANATPNTVYWHSSNPFVAIVEDGVITAVAQGECDIIVSCLDRHAICHVLVGYAPSAIIELDQHELRIKPNEIATLTPTATPAMPELAVSSSDMTVAAARVINGVVQVVGIKEGTATITVSSVDGTARPATCLVTVYTARGDVNGDGIVNIADVTALIDHILGGELENFSSENADMNGDGLIGIDDLTELIDFILLGGRR